uniref:Uncharacterized protein n=1 Tax=Oryzias latipes TaxID=8090 RepID=A0A3P9JSB1_ORYLA
DVDDFPSLQLCLRFSLLTLTLRVSPGVEDLAGVWERRLLGTVVKPEDSTVVPLRDRWGALPAGITLTGPWHRRCISTCASWQLKPGIRCRRAADTPHRVLPGRRSGLKF